MENITQLKTIGNSLGLIREMYILKFNDLREFKGSIRRDGKERNFNLKNISAVEISPKGVFFIENHSIKGTNLKLEELIKLDGNLLADETQFQDFNIKEV